MSKTSLILSAVALLAAGPALAQSVPPDLGQAAKAFDQAQLTANAAALGRLLADDYLLVNSAGANQTKAQFIADLTDPEYRLDPFSVEESITRVWGDGAILGGVTTLKGTDHGQPFSMKVHFADVWAKRGGKWQVIFTQVTKAP